MENNLKRIVFLLAVIICMLSNVLSVNAQSLLEEKEKYVIVIDPGHGGENLGTIANPAFMEKEILMHTANALVNELKKYDRLEVYLTRTTDVDISLRDRAVFAKEKKADFVFSLHYNASENHSMFGTEVWISLKPPYHALGYKFAYLQQLQMQDMGLFSRGIKTRKNDDDNDYYGIIRECAARNIPAVIIEHCYVDEERDAYFVDELSDYEELGRRDAVAIAKFLGVHQDLSDVEQSLFKIKKNDIISQTLEDHSGPDKCFISEEHIDYENGVMTVKVNAKDNQTPIMYYSYSIDGGKTFSKLYAWPDTDMVSGYYPQEFSLMINIPDGISPEILVRAYNKFDIYRTSNRLKGFGVFMSPTPPPAVRAPAKDVFSETKEKPANKVIYAMAEILDKEPAEVEISMKRFGVLVIFVIIWMLLLMCLLKMIRGYMKNKN